MQCQFQGHDAMSRSDVIFRPKSRIMHPFQSMATGYLAENTISVKNRTSIVALMSSYLRDLTSPGQCSMPKIVKITPPNFCKTGRAEHRGDFGYGSEVTAEHRGFGGHFRRYIMGIAAPSPTLHWRGLTSANQPPVIILSLWLKMLQ